MMAPRTSQNTTGTAAAEAHSQCEAAGMDRAARLQALTARLTPAIDAIHIETPETYALRSVIEGRLNEEPPIPDKRPLRDRPDGQLHLLSGQPQTGKTSVIQTAASAYLEPRSGSFAQVCLALKTEVPKNADGDEIVAELLKEFEIKVGRSGLYASSNVKDNRETLYRLMHRHHVRWIFLDSADRARMILAGGSRLSALDLIEMLTIERKVNVVVSGSSAIHTWVNSHPRLRSLDKSQQVVEPLSLNSEDRLRDFVEQFVRQLPKSLAQSSLTDPDTLIRLHIASSKGVQGMLWRLLRRATLIAIQRDHKRVVRLDLSTAHSLMTGEPDDENGLFRAKTVVNYRPRLPQAALLPFDRRTANGGPKA